LSHDCDWVAGSVFLIVYEFEVKVLREVSEHDLQVALGEGLAEADALARTPRQPAHCVPFLAGWRQEQG